MKKKISAEIKCKIISLSGKCFWYWKSFYSFYSTILNISSRELENKIPRDNYNKYQATEKILEKLERDNKTEIIWEIISSFCKLSAPFDKNDNPKYSDANNELKTFKKLVGKDVVEEEVNRKEFAKNLEKNRKENKLEQDKNKKIKLIKKDFYDFSSSEDRQGAGFFLERAFFDILDLEKIENIRPYKTKTEQIDGYFKFDKWDYLVEIKWTKEKIKQKDISIFDGKIKTKAQSTRGLILSIYGFEDSAIKTASSDSPKIIFLDSQDLVVILEEKFQLKDLLKTSIDNLVRYGKVYK